MLEWLTTYYTDFIAFSKSNPLFAGIISVWGLGVVTFCLRTVPSKIFNFIYRQCTTNLVLNSYDSIYHEFLQWVSENNMHSFVRDLNFNNRGVWSEGVPMISIGYGKTIFLFKRRLFVLHRFKEEANQTMRPKETIKITLIGRSHQIFSELFDVIHESQEEENSISVHTWKEGWNYTAYQPKRDLDTVVVEEHIKQDILTCIDNFIGDSDWYFKNGIPYHLGIMFHGPSGTGKTSLIKAICAKYDRPLYIIHLSRMSDDTLETALAEIPIGAVVAIEDIDTANLGKRNISNKITTIKQSGTMSLVRGTSHGDSEASLTLGGVLNALDGITTSEGRILIATTNVLDSLDEALIRPGRFDLTKEIGYMTDDTLRTYLGRFYPYDFSKWCVNDNVKPCDVQKLVFDNRNSPDNVLAAVAHRCDNGGLED